MDVLVLRPIPAWDRSAQPPESADRALPETHARELRRWTGCVGEAKAEGLHLGLRPDQVRLELPSLPREHDDLHHGEEQQGDRRQDRQDGQRCFHDQLPGTLRGFRRGAPRWIATIGPVVNTQRPGHGHARAPGP